MVHLEIYPFLTLTIVSTYAAIPPVSTVVRFVRHRSGQGGMGGLDRRERDRDRDSRMGGGDRMPLGSSRDQRTGMQSRVGVRHHESGVYRPGHADRRDDRRMMGGGVGLGGSMGMGGGGVSGGRGVPPAVGGGMDGPTGGAGGVPVPMPAAEPAEPSEKLKNKINGFVNEYVGIRDEKEALQVICWVVLYGGKACLVWCVPWGFEHSQ